MWEGGGGGHRGDFLCPPPPPSLFEPPDMHNIGDLLLKAILYAILNNRLQPYQEFTTG